MKRLVCDIETCSDCPLCINKSLSRGEDWYCDSGGFYLTNIDVGKEIHEDCGLEEIEPINETF